MEMDGAGEESHSAAGVPEDMVHAWELKESQLKGRLCKNRKHT